MGETMDCPMPCAALACVEVQPLMSSADAPAGPLLPMPMTSVVCHLRREHRRSRERCRPQRKGFHGSADTQATNAQQHSAVRTAFARKPKPIHDTCT